MLQVFVELSKLSSYARCLNGNPVRSIEVRKSKLFDHVTGTIRRYRLNETKLPMFDEDLARRGSACLGMKCARCRDRALTACSIAPDWSWHEISLRVTLPGPINNINNRHHEARSVFGGRYNGMCDGFAGLLDFAKRTSDSFGRCAGSAWTD